MAYEHGDSPPYTTKIDDTGTYKYVGEAIPGTATSSARWRIMRVTNATGNIDWAAHGDFRSVWDDRASLSYS